MKKIIILGLLLVSAVVVTVSARCIIGNNANVAVQDDDPMLKTWQRNIDASNKRIAELQAKGSLTSAEKEELDRLKGDVQRLTNWVNDRKRELGIAVEPVVAVEDSEPQDDSEVTVEEYFLDAAPEGLIPDGELTNIENAEPPTITNNAVSGEVLPEGSDIPMSQFTLKVGGGSKVFTVADVNDEAHVYGKCVNKKNTWIVISKKEFRIYVYEAVAGDTLLRATFPVCYARNAQDKTRTGDSCTPECRDANTPFTISQIQDASTWRHTFKNDPRGNILAYGPYFMRLKLTGSKVPGNTSIGIHGCGGYDGKSNSYSVPGRDSEGCIRLRDNDLKTLCEGYCYVGTKVYIKPATGKAGDKYPYELKAVGKCNGYVPATMGNPLSNKTKTL